MLEFRKYYFYKHHAAKHFKNLTFYIRKKITSRKFDFSNLSKAFDMTFSFTKIATLYLASYLRNS